MSKPMHLYVDKQHEESAIKEDSHEDHPPNHPQALRSSKEHKEASWMKNVKLTIHSSEYEDNYIRKLHSF